MPSEIVYVCTNWSRLPTPLLSKKWSINLIVKIIYQIDIVLTIPQSYSSPLLPLILRLNLIPWFSQNQGTHCYFDKNRSCIIIYIKRLITQQRDAHATKNKDHQKHHLAISLVVQASFFMAYIEEV